MSDILTGGVERVYLTFTDINGTPVDPTGITVTVHEPDGTSVPYSGGAVVNDPSATGLFYIDHPVTQIGTMTAKGVATTPKAAALLRFTSIG